MEGLTINVEISQKTHTEKLDDNNVDGFTTTDSTDDSKSSGDEDDIDEEKIHYRYLLLIAKVIGYPSREFTSKARKYYNRKDKLLYNPNVTPISIVDLLMLNCSGMDVPLATSIEEFLLEGLKYNPDQRITAKQSLTHKFLCDKI
jgi:hypothetical protein